ncbi:MAG TPA: Gfo/Idh/MocA family oxidoreductase, partial [Clostridia bacterium]|nr:Gfo/Idh/MocA family oxidoreductase [Clostridia bacterium]
MADKVRLVFPGTGFMGQIAHLQNYANLTNECEVVAVADPRENVARQVAKRYNVPAVYSNIYEMLEKEDYDAIVCIQNFSRHEALLPEVLSIGKPVMLEKPIALRPETGEMLMDIAKKHGTKVMIGYHKRSDPATETAKVYVDKFKASGEYGRFNEVRVLMADGDWCYCGIVPDVINSNEPVPPVKTEAPEASFTKEQQDYHGHVVNYYIHQINYLRLMMGEPYDVEYVSGDGVVMVAKG